MTQPRVLIKSLFNNKVYLYVFLTNPKLSILVLLVPLIVCPSTGPFECAQT